MRDGSGRTGKLSLFFNETDVKYAREFYALTAVARRRRSPRRMPRGGGDAVGSFINAAASDGDK
jgi:hypothetical protein